MVNIDLSNELKICRYNNGIKLMQNQDGNSQHTVADALKLPFPVYFNSNQIILKCNELCAEANGFISVKDNIGEKWFKPYKRKTVVESLKNEHDVIKNNKYKIIEDIFQRKDDVNLHVLSFKMPWYNINNEIIGLFGFSIFLGRQQPIGESLSLIAELGFLNLANNSLPKKNIEYCFHNNDILSKLSLREQQCLKYFIKGKTAKETANLIGLSYRTVESYFVNIKKKLGCQYKRDLLSI